jgi:putative ABC transport system substrate-binding protein
MCPTSANSPSGWRATWRRFFKGVNAGDIPFFLPTKFDLVINVKTAKSLGLIFPPAVLDSASEVIE